MSQIRYAVIIFVNGCQIKLDYFNDIETKKDIDYNDLIFFIEQ